MKFLKGKKMIAASIVAVVFAISCSSQWVDDNEKQKIQMALVLENMLQQHFNPPTMDDNFSQKVYDLYLKQLDHSKRFFTREDSIALAAYKIKLDDELKSGEYAFFEKANMLYEQRLQSIAGTYKTYLANPFDFTKDESIQLDADKRAFPKDDAELQAQWLQYFKYLVLIQIQPKLEAQEKAKAKGDTTLKQKSLEVLEQEARTKILKDHDDLFKRLQRETKLERFSEYVNAVVRAFDPHSDFFPPKEKENFDIQMSGKLEGIGATLQEKEGYIKVSSIVPGSPSYKQGELKPEDLILKVAQGNDEPVDIVDMRLDNAVKLIRGKKGTTVKLTVKKPDGAIKVISIVRDVVVMEEAYAKSMIVVDTKNKQRIGFIYLPSFYADFNNRNGRTCSEDVRVELLKLKEDKVDGIVLDLRNNGGGSLQDVVTMGGYFIEKGPIVLAKGKETNPYVFDDLDPGVVYDGPLVILVNHFSASASEILAAAMQDYKRAVILGSTTTFGKGTVQRIFELSPTKAGEPVGSTKVTTQKFYRINGGSTQLKGVIPDIVVPDLYQYLEIGEKEMEYALPWDQIKPASYDALGSKVTNLKTVQEKSKARIEKSEVFKHINSNALYLKSKQNDTDHSLNLKAYEKELLASEKEEESFKREENEIKELDFVPLKADAAMLSDTVKASRSKAFAKTLKKDIYLYEAVQVIKDIRK